MDKIILYTTHCPKCEILEEKMNSKNIEYDIVEDVEEILKTGYDTVPILKVGNDFLEFKQANDFINSI